ncbi:DUF2254 domain-containing protein [Methylobacterium oxalidis]|uniref:DUF2254 domain-containing protein n=1 Tax=Methylobacterium oxalidis TaxID=944322 RepID=A0A512IZX9_9HYPH|nr:DUF2254 domain-containing protein [Methylobacterium oxalidis]GEP03225.1 hypothetical protein MOX02_12630 [Methylobacterium oxalidis]GJE30834.1 hypothetical protein LDDCCGHA_1004 [Methylobacterium oxalidis]GLS67485.1 hypothetical protein GCM10007888_58690 [Methylobacterium oxalidis]
MSAAWLFRLQTAARRPWLRVALFSLGGVLAALASAFFAPLIPTTLAGTIGSEAVDEILSILAGGMLPVATFSLATMVQAYATVTSTVTPRAVNLLMQDSRAQNAVATFVGAFLFGVVGLIALKTDVYGEQGRVILFGVTLVVIALVVITLVRWVEHLAHLGQVESTIDRIEAAAYAAIRRRAAEPHLGGRPWQPPPPGAPVVGSAATGYVQHIDAGALHRLAEAGGLTLHLAVRPGSFVHAGQALVAVAGAGRDTDLQALAASFTIGGRRSFANDPRFGVIVLSEVTARALSSAINDPGTVIDVIGTLVRVLIGWAERRDAAPEEAPYPRLLMHDDSAAELFEDGFGAIARYGAGHVEVGIRLQKALAALHAVGGPEMRAVARTQSDRALERARAALARPDDVAAVEAAHALVGRETGATPA